MGHSKWQFLIAAQYTSPGEFLSTHQLYINRKKVIMPVQFLRIMKFSFSCNCAVIGDRSWKSVQVFKLSAYIIFPGTLQSSFVRFATLPVGNDIKRAFIIWWCKSIANFCALCVCVCAISERCRLIFCMIYILVCIICNKKTLCTL